MAGPVLTTGFADPVHQAQQVFRSVLDAMAHPGRVVSLAALPEPLPGLSPAATAVCLALLDFETPLWRDALLAPADDGLRFHCGAPRVDDPTLATFALIAAGGHAARDFTRFNAGSDECPEAATTLIIEVTALAAGRGATLSGPGIDGQTRLAVGGVGDGFWCWLADNPARFPRGLDFILTCGDRLAALPRSVRLIAEG